MSTVTHEGWANATTWAIALAIDNDRELLKDCLDIFRMTPLCGLDDAFREYLDKPHVIKACLAIAPWAFEDDWRDRVSFRELVGHYVAKVRELER